MNGNVLIEVNGLKKHYNKGKVKALDGVNCVVHKGEVLVIIGYLSGLAGKFIGGQITYVVAFYVLDIAMVATDLILTLRNRRLDAQRDRGEAA